MHFTHFAGPLSPQVKDQGYFYFLLMFYDLCITLTNLVLLFCFFFKAWCFLTT